MNKRLIAGLDVGSTKICAVVANFPDSESETDSEDIVVTGTSLRPFTGLRSGSVADPAAAIQAIEQAIDEAGREAGCDVESVYVGVTGAHIASLISTGRSMISQAKRAINQRDIEDVVAASRKIVLPPDRQIVHAIPLSFSIDGQSETMQPIGFEGTRLEVQTHIVHGATVTLSELEKCVTSAGLDIDETVLTALATGESVLLPEEKESGVCLLDIGGTCSNLGVFVSGVMYHAAVIPVGGNHVTNDIAYGLTVGHDEAERLKIQNGSSLVELVAQDDVVLVQQVGRDTVRKLRRRALIQIIEPRMQELFQLVLEELKMSDCLDKIPNGLVITGGGSMLNGCLEMVNQVLGLPVRLGSAYAGGLTSTLKQPAYATAMGLVQYGIRHRQSAAKQVEIPKQDPIRTVWNQLVQSIKRAVPPR